MKMTVLAEGLRFPEGPVAVPDGSIVLVEIEGKAVTRIGADGSKSLIAQLDGGPEPVLLRTAPEPQRLQCHE